ncbi:MAG: thiamine-monophosphate kinase [Candidatus Omnitrophica bacterium]|nr:thiamine-monophosphate kinase [Candidatus Omnitrophota bacterium]
MKTIKHLGEFGIIERISRKIKNGQGVIRGIGDDAAVIRPARGVELVTSDAIVDGVDFLRKKTPAALVGRKLLAINLSDIAAMGGTPRHAVLTLGLVPDLSIVWLDQFMNGLLKLASEWRVNLVGGDISRSKTLWASLTLLGESPAGKWISRSGARVGDNIYVTGALGGAIRGKHLTFTPRIKEAQEIVRKFHPSSMIDISDGLLQDLGHILDESRVGANIDWKSVPVSFGCTLKQALTDGEDFELLFTSAKNIESKGITRVGKIVPRSQNQVKVVKGYVHF